MSLARDRDKFIGITPSDYRRLSDRHLKIIRVLSSVSCHKLLDIGCGDGNFGSLVSRAVGVQSLYGVDVSPKAVELARSRGIHAERVDLDTEDLPYSDESFDAVMCGEVIEHLFDPDRLLENVRRVLKPNGTLVLSTPNLASIYNRVSLLLGYQPFDTAVSLRYDIGHLLEIRGHGSNLAPGVDHVRVFTYRSLLQFLKAHGFKPMKAYGASGASIDTWDSIPKYLRALKPLDSIVCHLPSLSFRVVIGATKQ